MGMYRWMLSAPLTLGTKLSYQNLDEATLVVQYEESWTILASMFYDLYVV
jgi:hypothetical protein